MKSLIFIILLMMAMPLVSANIIVSEIELNPAGDDSGNEWVELFSDSEINLEGYKLVNNDRGEFLLNETINNYKIIVFPKQWLDNSDEKIVLTNNNNETIYETPIFKDDKNNDLTWSLCNNEFKFINSTKEKENCPAEEQQEQETTELPEEDGNEMQNTTEEQAIDNEDDEIIEDNIINNSKEQEETNKNPIDITGQAIKQEEESKGNEENFDSNVIYESKSERMKRNAVYIFAMLLLTAIACIIIKDKA